MGEAISVEFVTLPGVGAAFSVTIVLLSVFIVLPVPSAVGFPASRPVLCMIEPSLRDRIRVD